jgi:ABC-type multidrug transport system fused ATPase/permease subunit
LTTLRFHYAATEVIHQSLLDTEAYATAPNLAESAHDGKPSFVFERALVLEHLSYQYPSMPGPAIDEVSLEIPRGHWVGLIGPTGAGKTTLIDLILGLYVPTSGRILVDGRDMKDDVAGWQRNLGYVPQDVYLMDDTVRRNVAFGSADEDIDDERVWQALRAAQIDNFVRLLPGELNAMIGERGDRLSGGERQRLGIARALYRDPAVLVVDEATANLDNDTEAAIVHTLSRLKGEKTIIAITHRLALVRDCDQIYLLKQGRLQKSDIQSDLDPTLPEFAGGAV